MDRYNGVEAAKIPTILYYDESGTVQATGAQTIGIEGLAEENDWRKAVW